MKSTFVFLFFYGNISFSQPFQKKLEFSLIGGWQHTLAQRGPQHETEVSNVRFVKPLVKTIGLNINVNLNQRFFYGLEFFYDEFDFGYEGESHNINNSGLGIASGMLGASDRIKIFKFGTRFGYQLYAIKRFAFNAVIIPSIGYYPYAARLNDTALNVGIRNSGSEIEYISYPAYQNEGFKFLLKGTLEAQYSLGKHFGISLQFSYQQGFSPFVIDTTNIIRPYDPGGPKQAKYWTRINGSGIQGHFGVLYRF